MPNLNDEYHHCKVLQQEDKNHVVMLTVWDYHHHAERKIFLYKRHKEQWLKYTRMYFDLEVWFWLREGYILGFAFSQHGNMRRFS